MLVLKLIFAILTLASTSLAFYPWYPEYMCLEGFGCNGTTGSLKVRLAVPAPEPTLNLKLVQRIPKDDVSHEESISQLAARLTRKYQRGFLGQHKELVGNSISKRQNIFSIMSPATPTQPQSAGIYQDGTDYSYFAQVLLGSGQSPMYMLLDTGAGTTWVMGSSCTSGPCKIHNQFDPSKSSSFKSLSENFAINYGSGRVGGTLGTDSLSLAGLTLTVTLGIANDTSNDFNHFPIDGILGLSMAKSSNPSFLDTVIASKALKSNVFGVNLNRASDGPNTGEINFGAPDTSKYSGDLSYVSVDPKAGGDWAVPLGNVGVGSKQSGITTRLAYLDTGTSFIFCGVADAKTFHATIPGATSPDGVTWSVPCSTTDNLVITLGGKTFSVPPKDWFSPKTNGACTSNIYGQDIVGGNWLLGDTFLKSVYAVFDADQSRIGLAQKNAPVAASSSTTGAISSSPSSTGMPSSTSGPASTTTSSNGTPPGTQTTATSPAGSTGSSISGTTVLGSTNPVSTSSPGLNGHETPTTGTLAAQTNAASASAAAASASAAAAAASASASKKSMATRLESCLLTIPFGLLIFTLLS